MLFFLLASLVFAPQAHAFEEAGRLERRFDRPVEPLSSPKPMVFPLEEKLPPAQAAQIRFILKEVRIDGATALSAEALRETYADRSALESARELQYGSASHTQVLGTEGTTFNLGWLGTRSRPGTFLLESLDIDTQSDLWFIRVAHPFIRTRQHNLLAHFSFDYRDTSTNTLGRLTGLDRIRSVRFGVNYDLADRWQGVSQALLEYSHGIGGMGATSDHAVFRSRLDGKPDYDKFNLLLSRLQPLGHFASVLSDWSLYLAVMGQYSGDGLMAPEECGLGGAQFGRAYNYSELLGDSCIAGSMELRYQPNWRIGPLNFAQIYTFYDGGYVSNHAPLFVGGSTSDSLSSTGVGLRYAITNYTSGYVELTKPLTRDVAQEGNKDVRIFASFSMRF
ncbi:MAG: hypothetical protein NTX45_09435 [Proteobacteria bacterium]|nr:hypothetical protein [Pseudomonadota bacterium]